MANTDPAKENAALKKKNAKLEALVISLEDQLGLANELNMTLNNQNGGSKKPKRTQDWETELDELVDQNPAAVEASIRGRYGLPSDYKSNKLSDYAHARARSADPVKFVAELKTSINATGNNK